MYNILKTKIKGISGNNSRDAFDLRTALTGKIMLKLSMHGIKVVAVVSPEEVGNSRYAEMAMEGSHLNKFSFFFAIAQGEI